MSQKNISAHKLSPTAPAAKPAPVVTPPGAVTPAVSGALPAAEANSAEARGINPRPVLVAIRPEGAGATQAAPQTAPKPTGAVAVDTPGVRPAVRPAPLRRRHRAIALSFILVALLPGFLAAAYMMLLARDQYHSMVSFTVQTESSPSASGLFNGLTQLVGTTSSASDQEILYQYILSQDLTVELDQRLDLRGIYSQNWPRDPLFAFNPRGSVEDLHAFWLRNITVNQDNSGLVTVTVTAPSAAEAQLLSQTVFDLAAVLINRIAAATRDDAVRYARDELSASEKRLAIVRQELAAFRLRTQIIDPTADLQGQMGIINTLQARLADTLIEIDKLSQTSSASDPRLIQLELTRSSTERLISEERRKFGVGGQGPGGEDYATLFSEYERLSANMLFAESSYQAAVAGYDTVIYAAARQARYLAAHVRPTLAERALYPKRLMLTATAFGLGFLLWALGILVYYSVRDRR